MFQQIKGVIERRILVNYRIDPAVLQNMLPAPFKVKQFRGYGIGGICLIRLKHVRPAWLPAWLGFGSENAAHRIAVEWEAQGQLHEGVYIPRRDTSVLLNQLAGGRIFPGVHHRTHFFIDEADPHYRVAVASADRSVQLVVEGSRSAEFPPDSIFETMAAASDFFAAGSLGYSARPASTRFDGLELESYRWEVEPLSVTQVYSNIFDQAAHFPPGSIHFDCALLMRNIPHAWHARPHLQPAVAQAHRTTSQSSVL